MTLSNRLYTVEEVTSNQSGDYGKDDFKFKRGSIRNMNQISKKLNSEN